MRPRYESYPVHEYFAVLTQSGQDSLPLGTTLAGAILATDKTHLTNFSGDKVMYPAYVTIGNIHSSIRRKLSMKAYKVVAYFPVTKFPNTDFAARYKSRAAAKTMPGVLAKRLFHHCMRIVVAPLLDRTPREVVDAEGYVRYIVTVILAYIADLEEQTMVAGVRPYQCPNCQAGFEQMDHAHVCPPRTSIWILETIAKARRRDPTADTWGFVMNARDLGLCGVEYPWWMDLGIDVGRVISQDALHGLHKAFRDHDLKWIQSSIGRDELDRRFRMQHHRTGYRSFPKGISHISQWSGKEDRDVQRLILGVIAGAENATPAVVNAVRSRLDFMYLAQLPQHTDHTLRLMSERLADYNSARLVYIRNGARRGKNGVINHMKYPKGHANHHYAQGIKYNGTIDNYSTETPETNHIASCKEPWKESNRKDFMYQVIRRLTRHECIHLRSSFMQWREQQLGGGGETLGEEETSIVNGPSHVKLAKIPHFRSIPIQDIARLHAIPGLYTAIARYVHAQDSGLPVVERRILGDDHIPSSFKELDLWTSFRISPKCVDERYDTETFTIHCRPASTEAQSVEAFDPVLIQVGGTAENFTLKGAKVHV
jgi:hypothetical protein